MTASKPKKFEARIIAAGGELLAPTNEYETMRFKTSYGVGVVYRDKRGRETWNAAAQNAADHLNAGKGSLAPVKVRGRKRPAGTVAAIMKRDGPVCLYCRKELGDDITIEHFVSIAHGGPNHISNLFLAHAVCNRRAGHLSAPEKIALIQKEAV